PGEPDLRNWEWHYLYSLCHKDVATLHGHRSSVNWLAWSPDGQRLATASSDATVRVWDAITRKETATLLGHSKPVDWVAWSPDGERIYSHSESEAVRIWDSTSGKPLGSMSADMPALKAVSNHDGSKFITIHDKDHDKDLVKTWDASGGHELNSWQAQLYRGPTELLPFPKDLLFAFSNKLLVSGAFYPAHIHILNATTGGSLYRKSTQTHGITSMAFSPDGLRLLTGGSQGQIKLWDPSSAVELLNIQGHDGEVRQTAWRPDGQQWVTVGNDGKIKLWDASSGQEINSLRGHSAQVKSVAWNTDGSLLATGDASGAVKLWNPAQTQESMVLEGRTLAAWSPDGTRLVTGGREVGSVDEDSPDIPGKIDIYDTDSWKPVVTLEDQFFGFTKSADWSPEGRRLAMSGRGGRVKVWEIPTTRELLSVTAHPVGTRGVAWSPSGQWLATAGYDKLVKIWDVTSGDQVA
ncbi:MAG: WD40 repeat domain-containing protein, partial [Planctomycetales bacterium]